MKIREPKWENCREEHRVDEQLEICVVRDMDDGSMCWLLATRWRKHSRQRGSSRRVCLWQGSCTGCRVRAGSQNVTDRNEVHRQRRPRGAPWGLDCALRGDALGCPEFGRDSTLTDICTCSSAQRHFCLETITRHGRSASSRRRSAHQSPGDVTRSRLLTSF